jgi:hypothetical protein
MITLRIVKGSELTYEELDENFVHLDDTKINKSVLSGNHKMIITGSGGELQQLNVQNNRLVGRLGSGGIVSLTAAQVKTLLGLIIADVDGLQAALDGKASDSHTHDIADVIDLQTTLDAKATPSDIDNKLGGYELFAIGKATLSDGTALVTITDIDSNDIVELFHQSEPNSLGPTISSNTLIITSSNGSDDGEVFYKVWREI